MSSAGAAVADLGLPGGEPAAPADRQDGAAGPSPPHGALPRPGGGGSGRRRAGGPALAVTYLSLLVLLPLAALFTNAFSGGWSAFWAAVTQPEAVAALELTLVASASWPSSTPSPASPSPSCWCATTSGARRS